MGKEVKDTSHKIEDVIQSLLETLLEKNKRYGNSALDPINIFCKLDASHGIQQRLDDKLMRIKNSNELRKNDIFDLMGYLVLLSVNEEWDFEDLID